jgi:nucleoid DNA-binding protein
MANVTHSEMVSRIAKKCDLSEQETKKLLETMADQIAVGAAGDGLEFRGFGRFTGTLVNKTVFNPKAGVCAGTRTYISLNFKPLGDGVSIHE